MPSRHRREVLTEGISQLCELGTSSTRQRTISEEGWKRSQPTQNQNPEKTTHLGNNRQEVTNILLPQQSSQSSKERKPSAGYSMKEKQPHASEEPASTYPAAITSDPRPRHTSKAASCPIKNG
ncbi:hypothetical protein Nepgr_021100 [Nepenthes gracilis]|uniref:Uncharacterized protein n=1 Tax=Nepenthes gracilis TaxID=150966 RepID=A0AAD3XWR2_NEPGR|nr:hypothetical protein Nepgr_021100 [Nepenthes gracilis]